MNAVLFTLTVSEKFGTRVNFQSTKYQQGGWTMIAGVTASLSFALLEDIQTTALKI